MRIKSFLLMVNDLSGIGRDYLRQQVTFIINEECVGTQGVLIIGDIFQDIRKINIYSNNPEQQVSKVTWFTYSHYQALE